MTHGPVHSTDFGQGKLFVKINLLNKRNDFIVLHVWYHSDLALVIKAITWVL